MGIGPKESHSCYSSNHISMTWFSWPLAPLVNSDWFECCTHLKHDLHYFLHSVVLGKR